MTRTGRGVAASATLLVVAGVLTGYPELIGFGAACLAALAIGIVVVRVRPEVNASRKLVPSRVTEGTPGKVVVRVSNTGRRRTLPLVVNERLFAGRLELKVPSLPPGGAFEASYTFKALGRGVYSVGPSTISRCDPLRLLSIAHLRLDQSALHVHPRQCRLDLAAIGHTSAVDGMVVETSPRGGVEFHSLRPYETGNDFRLVHWKASARVGTLMVRTNVLPQEPRLTVVLDTSDVYSGDFFEEAVRIAASLCVSACTRSLPVSLRTTRGDEPSGKGTGPAGTALLDYLAAVRVSQDDRGLLSFAESGKTEFTGSRIVVTGHPGLRRLTALGAARRRHLPLMVVQVGDRATAVAEMKGISVVAIESVEDFQSVWNRGAVK